MKFTATLILAALSSAAAFAPSAFGRVSTTSLEATVNRKQFLSQFTAATLATTILTVAPNMASAAKYGSFGADSPLVLNPTDAIIDEEILKSTQVQDALGKIKAYLNGVVQMKAALETEPQTDVGPYLRKEFDFVALRTSLNTVNSAFDEDTQRGTDRLIRNIMQDITELETSNRQKPGVPRSDIRLNIMKGKLDKLAKAFGDYLAFAS